MNNFPDLHRARIHPRSDTARHGSHTRAYWPVSNQHEIYPSDFADFFSFFRGFFIAPREHALINLYKLRIIRILNTFKIDIQFLMI